MQEKMFKHTQIKMQARHFETNKTTEKWQRRNCNL